MYHEPYNSHYGNKKQIRNVCSIFKVYLVEQRVIVTGGISKSVKPCESVSRILRAEPTNSNVGPFLK